MQTIVPEYWQVAALSLAKNDPVMSTLVTLYGSTGLASRGDPFSTLARSIVGQQISVKAADAIWARFVVAVTVVDPVAVLQAGEAGLAQCGLSRRKIEYLLDLARHFVSGQLEVGAWQGMEDEAVITELCGVRGIGRWTAEMCLIFNLLRPIVFPLDDIGVQRAVLLNYLSVEKQSRSSLAEFAERWWPWRTVATWYLWRSLDPVPVEY